MKLLKASGLLLGLLLSNQLQALTVASSFSIIEDMVKQVGGSQVKVVNMIGPDADAHHYEMKPDDLKKLSSKIDPKVFFINGLGLDPWAPKMAKAADFQGKIVVVSDGIKKRKFVENVSSEEHDDHDHDHDHEGHDHKGHDHEGHDHKGHDHEGHDHKGHDHKGHDHKGHDHKGHDHKGHDHEGHDHGHHHHGEFDPHAWQSIDNAIIYINNIEKALRQVDPKHAEQYTQNAKAYKDKLRSLDVHLKKEFSKLPKSRRHLVISHDALGYFADAYGLTLIAPMGLSTDAEPSAKDVAEVVNQIRSAKIPAVFLENIQNPKLLEQIAKESGAHIGGTLYTDALSKTGVGSTYFGMIQSNGETILKALK